MLSRINSVHESLIILLSADSSKPFEDPADPVSPPRIPDFGTGLMGTWLNGYLALQ